jgi:hypothetical protein
VPVVQSSRLLGLRWVGGFVFKLGRIFPMKQALLKVNTQPSTSFVVASNKRLLPVSQQSTNSIKMSQIATLNNSEATGAIIGAENANPNSESVVILKSQEESAENLICSENVRSESSTPVKEIHDEQSAANNQLAGDMFDKIQII